MKHLPVILAMLLSITALAEDVYYCLEDDNTGFINNEKTGFESGGDVHQD